MSSQRRPYSPPQIKKYASIDDLPAHLRQALKLHPFVVFDGERRYSLVSESFARMLGYRAEELVGSRIDDITPEDTLDIESAFGAFLTLGDLHGLWVFKHRNGSNVLVRYRACRTGDILYAEIQPLQLQLAA